MKTKGILATLAALLLVVGIGALTLRNDDNSSFDGDHAIGVPVGEVEAEGSVDLESEAEERTLTRRQATPRGTRSAKGNRVGPRVQASEVDGRARAISGPSLLAGCPGLPGTITDYEAEPHLASNPRKPNNLIATWQQDRSFAARGSVAAFTRDGGRSWRTVTIPGADTCDPGTDWLGVADPWVTFDSAGVAYLASLPGGAFPGPDGVEIRASVIVNRSSDGGKTWSKPSVVVPPDGFNDKEMIAADPRRKGLIYAVWEKSGGSTCTGGRCVPHVYFSRSTNGARTWSAPVLVEPAASDKPQHNARLIVMRDGSLRLFVEHGDFREERHLMMLSSRDRGRTWSKPRELLTQTNRLPAADGSDPFYAIFEEGIGGDGAGRSLYIAFANATSDDARSRSTVALLESDNGGRTWRRDTIAKLRAFAMQPSVIADASGRVALTWYDFTRDKPGDGQMTATYRTAVRDAGARRWRLGSLASFDASSCGKFSPPGLPGPKLPWIGEYFGLVPHRGRFATAFMACGALSKRGPEDVLFAHFS